MRLSTCPLTIAALSSCLIGSTVNAKQPSLYDWPWGASGPRSMTKVDGKLVPLVTDTGLIPFDGVYVAVPDSSTFEWFSFDAVDEKNPENSVVFQVASPIPGITKTFSFMLSITQPGGKATSLTLPFDASEKLTLLEVGDAVEAGSLTKRIHWTARPDLSEYTLTINWPAQHISGSLTFSSRAQAQVPGAAYKAGSNEKQSIKLRENLLWVNALPDASVQVNMSVNGAALSFTGAGFHDQIIGTQGLSNIDRWYKGHAHLGPYSLVWYICYDSARVDFPAAVYIAKDGKPIWVRKDHSQNLSIVALGKSGERLGAQPDFNVISGFSIDVDANEVGHFLFVTHKSAMGPTARPEVYHRWSGTIEGGKVGEKNYTGVTMYEQMGPF